ncbi:Ger(x)C family spore germination protein [Lederbergia wuyishanensis]|uniref:Spore germination protein KC n=1 Tax=Lederbergia wuyishanensis TaxID=1347903 RepID=A0ABU0D5P0_9BACI|nr:Ger(x)C family spore germination protein [Lederbergia wuyishanensis]MCJ8008318.1 Ger(x)C family spore germination protein [Lederbergia wuyishanensis]MDQ0343730.1 spore germination protein KC [Lederbergia wuyishanensis]
MKRILHLIFFLGMLVLLTGCWDRVEINDQAIITATAIDQDDNGKVEITLQIFIPKSFSTGGSGGPGSTGPVTFNTSQRGDNIADALSKIQGKLSRKLFWGQCKVFIFGEEVAKSGIKNHIDYLLRQPQPRERALLFVASKAKKALEMPAVLERYSSEGIKEQSKLTTGIKVTLQDFDEMLVGNSSAASLPYLKISKEKHMQGQTNNYAHIYGTAIFKKDKMIGKMSERETRGLLWIKDELRDYTVTIKIDDDHHGEISLNPVSAQIHLIPKIQNNKWSMIVKIKTEGAIALNTTNLDITKAKAIKTIEKAYEKKIHGRVKLAVDLMQDKLNADIVDFAKEFHRKYPKEWEKVEKNWNEKFPEVDVVIDVNAHVKRQGYINDSAGRKKSD